MRATTAVCPKSEMRQHKRRLSLLELNDLPGRLRVEFGWESVHRSVWHKLHSFALINSGESQQISMNAQQGKPSAGLSKHAKTSQAVMLAFVQPVMFQPTIAIAKVRNVGGYELQFHRRAFRFQISTNASSTRIVVRVHRMLIASTAWVVTVATAKLASRTKSTTTESALMLTNASNIRACVR